ncbi:MAG: dTMP kinase, partial [Acidobacteria bacterium]|nr:dTMP kinase [Acidobacteriota bacterium]
HKIAEDEPDRFRLVDGSGSIDEVAATIWAEVQQRLRRSGL